MIRYSLRRADPTLARAIGPLTILAVALAAPAAVADDGLSYNRDIRPILTENCFACHGPDSAARKADLRLDQRDAAVEAGALAPGDPDGSELVFRIESDDRETVMPPPKTGKTLTDAQKETLRRWIADGAEYQPHWSLIAPTRPEPPAVQDESWVRNPIDRFLLARLEAEGLKPAPEADRRTLARRAALDLTGLPPEPADVEAFVNDPAPDAYEKYVESLMRSPRWGEHRARTWLDAARYADTHGYHFDNYREMWSYRDWVIAAFNRNLPFDEFIVEQLAGDLLPDATLDQRIASGFNRCNMTTNEGGTIPEENLVNYTRDRTETFGQVFLGVTTGCAVCHDHKFDPLSQREFYELAAFFNNTTQGALDGNIKDTPPIVIVPDPEDRPRWSALQTELADVNGQIEQRKASARPEFDSWLAAQSPETLAALAPADDLRLHALLGPRDAAPTPIPALLDAAAGDFEKDQPFAVAAWVKLAPKQTGSIVARMDDQHGYRGWDLWVEGNRVGMHVVHTWQDDALKAVTDEVITPGRWTHVLATYDGSGQASGVKVYLDGELKPTRPQTDALKNTIKTDVPLKVGQRHTTGRLDGAQLNDVRLYGHALSPDAAGRLAGAGRASALLAMPAEQRPAEELDALFAWWVGTLDPASKELNARRATLQQEQDALKARGTIAHIMHEKADSAMAFVLFRGDYDKRRDQVSPGTPAALPPLPEDLPRNRLGLARWLLRPEHPLTARVAVNRFWQEVFGTGLVRTAGDFGVSGELPSHPELLDWLAVEFRESGWDVQHLFRLLVTSAAYRQAATASPETIEKDPQNRLLSRGPRFRMDAEMVRDTALAASGLLVEKLGGPSVKPYQPEGVWEAVAMPESNTRLYKQDHGERLYRRSLYTFWKRAAPPASMEILNAPNREVCTVRRERTNTPLQALVTLNDPQFVEAARALAGRTLHESCACDEMRLDAIAGRLLARPLRPEEQEIARDALAKLVAYYRDHPDDAARLLAVGESKPDPALDPTDLAAWTMLANMLMNLDEVLNK